MRTCLFAAFLACPLPVQAHPHVFIEAGLSFLTDQNGQLAAVEVIWAYDELFSLLFLAENGLVPAADDTVPADKLSALAGQDAPWGPDFDGDLVVSSGGVPLPLSGPLNAGLIYRDGRLISHHLRALPDRVALGQSDVDTRMFDPDYYVAYEVTLKVTLPDDPTCALHRQAPDLHAAYDAIEEALYGPTSSGLVEENFPKVGALFAETLTLSCRVPSR